MNAFLFNHFRWIKQHKLSLAIVFGLFLLSIWLRVPQINRPLCDHHEWVTAHTMIILENWELQGALKNKFCLLVTYPGETNKFIPLSYGRLVNDEGQGFYASFPPLALLAPYALFKLFSIPLSALNLEIFNLAFHFISVVFVYLIFNLVLKDGPGKQFAALLGCAYFIFLPANLWFFSNVYSWDIFWHYLWVIGIYQVLKIAKDIEVGKIRSSAFWWLGLNIFLVVFTEFTGILFALSVVVLALFRFRKTIYFKRFLWAAILPAMVALLLFVVQYSSIAGFAELRKYFQLTSLEYQFNGIADIRKIVKYFLIAYMGLFPTIVILLWIGFKRFGGKLFSRFSSLEVMLIFLGLFPVIFQILLQLSHSAEHDFRVVKACVGFIAVVVLLWNHLIVSGQLGKFARGVLVLVFLASMILTWPVYSKHYAGSGDPKRYVRLAKEIHSVAKDDEVIFIISDEVENEPPLVSHVRRNMVSIKYADEALEWLNQYDRKKGIVLNIDKHAKLTGFERIASEINP